MRVDDLARDGRADLNVAGDASILGVGGWTSGKVLFPISVTAEAEARLPHRDETEAMIVVVTGRAQTTAELHGRSIPDEPACALDRYRESVSAERGSSGLVTVERALESGSEVLAEKCLLVLGLVAAAALAVGDRLGEVGMAPSRVALPAPDAFGRVTTLGIVGGDRPGVAGRTVFDIRGRPGDRSRVRPLRRPPEQDAPGDGDGERDDQKAPSRAPHAKHSSAAPRRASAAR